VSVTGFSIGEVAARTGVAEGTLRMWERRHGFPAPERLPMGHRRYSERDIELVRRVSAERAAGVSLAVAIERAGREPESDVLSVYASLRRRWPDLEPRRLAKPVMVALSHAIEDESLSRADRPLMLASFQRERFYRQAEARWRELSRGAKLALVFADFQRVRAPRGGPAEIPVDRGHPLAREWAVVCDAAHHAVCLAAWEPPSATTVLDEERVFEAIWSVEPRVVREAARMCIEIATSVRPGVVESVRPSLEPEPAPVTGEQLRLAAAITNRTLSYLG
jgi:MerR family transcriptional regulator, light-induced transcriptional regulator